MANTIVNPNDPVQKWVSELEAAGWKKWRGQMTVWESPYGLLYRGPRKAWEMMQQYPILNSPKESELY